MKKILNSKIILLICLISAIFSCTAIQRKFAPKFFEQGIHSGASQMSEEKCLSCHREGLNGSPIAPEKMLNRKNCTRCHLKKGSLIQDSLDKKQYDSNR